jgi:hypothetical protein
MGISGIMLPGRYGVNRRLCDTGSYSPAIDDSAEVQSGSYGGFSEREVSDSDIQELSVGEAEFYRSPFPGTWILR